MTIAEMFIKLGVKTDKKALSNINDSVGALAKKAAFATAAISGTLFALDRLAQSTIQNAVNLENFNNQTGLSIEKLQQWQIAAQLSDVTLTFDQVTSSVQGLQKQLTDLKLGLGGEQVAGLAGLLGLSIDQSTDAFDFLEQLRAAIKDIDDATATNLIERIGLNPSFINVLRLSNSEFQKLGGKAFLSDEQRKRIVELGTALTDLKIDFNLLKDEGVAKLTPLLIKLVSVFRNVSEVVGEAIKFYAEWHKKLLDNEIILGAIIGILGGLALAIAPMTTMIIALIATLDDLHSYLEGELSVIGALIDEFTRWGEVIEKVTAPLDKLLGIYGKLAGLPGIGASIGAGLGNRAADFIKSSATVTNNFNINSNQDAVELSKNIVSKEQDAYAQAYDEINNSGEI